MSRLVTLALVDRQGEFLGSLPPYRVELPWWSEVGSVVAGAFAHHHADVTVLRLLDVDPDIDTESGLNGRTEYLAELNGPLPAALVREERAFADDPRRVPWARPGGPAGHLAWADRALKAVGRELTGPAMQLRTWNLSSIWRLRATGCDVWLKVVPSLLAHEGAVLNALARQGAPVPNLVAFDGSGRILLDHVPGENQWSAEPHRLMAMVQLLVSLQVEWAGSTADLLSLGVNDWRRQAFTSVAGETVASWSARLPIAVSSVLHRLVDGLDERFAGMESCGVPDTLVHGDFHPGNLRFDGTSLVLLDWGDCGLGNPMLDMAGFLGRIDEHRHDVTERSWLAAWSVVLPGSDPYRAFELVRPLAALRRAVVYHRFVEAFEPSEQPYHESDVPRWLFRAATLA